MGYQPFEGRGVMPPFYMVRSISESANNKVVSCINKMGVEI